MEVRVRLVFADDVGRHVQRQRGFSSCWYLVPKDAKLVGDLAHALQREFGLRKRCPQGLELRLEELPVLATQSIRLVRDNDTIVVQCPLAEDALDGSETSSESEEETKSKRRKRKGRGKKKEQEGKDEEPPHKKPMRYQAVLKKFQDRPSAEKKTSDSLAVERSGRVESSSSSSSSSSSESSSSSSNSSSSSSSESEDEPVVQQSRGRKTSPTTAKTQQVGKPSKAASASNGVPSKATDSEQNGKEPRRRRRRLRQRNGRRQRNGNQEMSAAENSVEQASSSASNLQSQEAPRKDSAIRGHTVGNITGPRGYPTAKAHVLFDEETGDQMVVQHVDDNADTRESTSNWAAQYSKAPELAKYGPSSSSNQRSKPPRDNFAHVVNEESNDYDAAPKRKGKGKYEERWKRPYEIVATVLDKTSEKASKPDLTKSLASYPTATAGSVRLKDIIAFKTLTLCLETWQPILSEWQCGQVQSIDTSSSSIELSKWILAATGNSIDFREAPNSEGLSVQTSEISELRFLSGPSLSLLQQAGK